jgi:hypothetical protein
VITDDASNEDNRIEDLVNQFNYPIEVHRIPPEQKTWINPCIPYNIGLKRAKGDLIVIQNPECLHIGDVLSDVKIRLSSGKYLIYPCFGLSESKFRDLSVYNTFPEFYGNVKKTVNSCTQARQADGIWYNHKKLRYRPYHFCSAICKKDLNRIGGFDESFADGYWYDDNEFSDRVRRNILIEDIYIGDCFVVHQWHPSHIGFTDKDLKLKLKNKKIYDEIRKKI